MKDLSVVLLLGCITTANADTSRFCPGESGYFFTNDRSTNPRKGGFVSNSAYVSEEAFIAPTASVCGSASVEAKARIMGKAIVKDEAVIGHHVKVMGNAIIGGSAQIYSGGKRGTIIKGYARIMDGVIEEGIHGTNELPDDVIRAKAAEENRKRQKEEQKRREKQKAAMFKQQYELVKFINNSDFTLSDSETLVCKKNYGGTKEVSLTTQLFSCRATAKASKTNPCGIEIKNSCYVRAEDNVVGFCDTSPGARADVINQTAKLRFPLKLRYASDLFVEQSRSQSLFRNAKASWAKRYADYNAFNFAYGEFRFEKRPMYMVFADKEKRAQFSKKIFAYQSSCQAWRRQ